MHFFTNKLLNILTYGISTMQITINMDTDKETAEELIRLQKALDEIIGKKLGAVSKHSQPQQEQPEPQPQQEPIQTVTPEPEPPVESAGFPTQPEEQPEVDANSPHELGQQVEQQSQQQDQQQDQQPEPQQEEKPKEETQGEKGPELEDISGAMSKLYSGGN